MKDYRHATAMPWHAALTECENADQSLDVTVGEGITNVGGYALSGPTGNLTLPDGVVFGDQAFSMCESLTSVTIPDTWTMIPGKAF